MSTREEELKEALDLCFSDWGDDFCVDVEAEEFYKDHEYFNVVITYSRLSKEYEFPARVSSSGECEIDYNEDSWNPLTMGNVFAFMWFDEVYP